MILPRLLAFIFLYVILEIVFFPFFILLQYSWSTIHVISVPLYILFAFAIVCRLRGRKGVSIFHPFCNQNAGGEKVLWCIVDELCQRYERIYIITDCTSANSPNILQNAELTFGIPLSHHSPKIQFVGLSLLSRLVGSKFSLIRQAWNSVELSMEGLTKDFCQTFIDTSGYPFVYPAYSLLGGCSVHTYTHYPWISSDMMAWTRSQLLQSKAGLPKTLFRLGYMQVMMIAYRAVGMFCSLVMTNSSWTQDHMKKLWSFKQSSHIPIVFPPCNLSKLAKCSLSPRSPLVISLGQFRPEKDHDLQIRIFARVLQTYNGPIRNQIRFIMIGGARQQDQHRVTELKQQISALGLDDQISLEVNASRDRLEELLSSALIGVHTMREEHFGISVVEMMAAGTVTIAHRSGGPLRDIVVPHQGANAVGFLASSEEEFSDHIVSIFQQYEANPSKFVALCQRARTHVLEHFTVEAFHSSLKLLAHHLD